MTRIGIMQVTDTLEMGGLERVAVNVANGLARKSSGPICAPRARKGRLRI